MARHRLIVTLLVVGVLLLLIAPSALAAPNRIIWDPLAEPSWKVAINGAAPSSSDVGNDVAMADGGVTWVTGSGQRTPENSDISLTKIVNGVEQWTKWWDSPVHLNDRAMKLALGPGGVVYTVGSSETSVGDADMIVVKWSKSGAVKWAKRFDGAGHKNDYATTVGVDDAGNVTVSGHVVAVDGIHDWVTRSYKPSGAVRWTWKYDGGAGTDVLAKDMLVLGDGTVYGTGMTMKSGANSALTVRLSPTGKKIWAKQFRGADGLGAVSLAIARCPSGGIYVSGAARTVTNSEDGLVMRYSPKGKRTVFALESAGGGNHVEQFLDIAVTSTKRIVAVGLSDKNGTQDGQITTYTTAGSIVGGSGITWPGVNGDDWFWSVAADSMGGFSLTGKWCAAAGRAMVAVLRGSTLAGGGGWAALYDETPTPAGWGYAVAVRGTTTVVAGLVRSNIPDQGSNQIILGWVY